MCFPFVSAKIMLSVGSCKLFIRNMLLCLPNLYAVNDVLPQDITARSYRRQGREVGTGYPYGEGGVLLSESLTGVHRLTEFAANCASASELEYAKQQRPDGDEQHKDECGFGVEDVLHRSAGDDEQRASPEVV